MKPQIRGTTIQQSYKCHREIDLIINRHQRKDSVLNASCMIGIVLEAGETWWRRGHRPCPVGLQSRWPQLTLPRELGQDSVREQTQDLKEERELCPTDKENEKGSLDRRNRIHKKYTRKEYTEVWNPGLWRKSLKNLTICYLEPTQIIPFPL